MTAHREIPRLVVAGTSSGSGKTTLAVALTAALRARGLKVAVFKCGPDYLDPTYHARAAGSPCHNLDGWMMGREAVLGTFARASAGADIAIVEGVMGLFDGASPTEEDGSTAQIAKWLQAPVLLLVDASGMARTIAAVARGFVEFDREVRLSGIVANKIGSRSHLDILQRACGAPPILGGFPDEPSLAFPERHLGLRSAFETAVSDATLATWGERAREWLDIERILSLARSAPVLAADETSAPSRRSSRCRIGLAFDEAFHFYYEDNLRSLERNGAELVRFSPIDDARLPEVDGLYFGGGYPEVHAERLSHNLSMRADIVSFARRSPIYAECGGLMYLSRAIVTTDGRSHDMVGLVPARAVMREKLRALGYVEVETQERTLLGPAGLRFRGHQFRYSELEGFEGEAGLVYSVRKRRGGETAREGYRIGNVLASYVHAHWASNPLVAAGFVDACSARAGSVA